MLGGWAAVDAAGKALILPGGIGVGGAVSRLCRRQATPANDGLAKRSHFVGRRPRLLSGVRP